MNTRDHCTVKVFQQTAELGGNHFQGDIIKVDNKLPEVSVFNAVCNPAQLWPNKTVYYCIKEKGYSMDQIESIEEAIKMVETSTQKCISIYRTSQGSKENYVEIIKPPATQGYATHVGMLGGAQPMYLDQKCLFHHGTIMHAFMHVLGFHHEHIREDRDAHVTVHWENISDDHWINFSRVDSTLINEYDYDSIMHWGSQAYAMDTSKPTLTPKSKNTNIGQRERLSEQDVEKIQVLYGVREPKDTEHLKTFNIRDLFTPAKWVHKVPGPIAQAKESPASSK